MDLGKKNILATLAIFIVLYIVIVVYGQQYLGDYAYFLLYLVVALGLYVNFLLKTKLLKTGIDIDINGKYKQLEILTGLYGLLDIKVPLPETGGWAASPDLLKKITDIILKKKPLFIVEASSGVKKNLIHQ